MAGSVMLLLLASLNVAGLLLARGAARAREFTTRMAIGASRGRIAGQLLVESLLIAVGGGVLGLLAAPALSRVILLFLPQDGDVALRIDASVLAFAFIASAITAVICGLAPALQTRRTPLVASLTDRSRVAAGGGVRMRKALVAGQLAFTLVLLIGSGLFVQTVTRLHGNLGFDGDNLVTISIDPPANGHAEPDAERIMRDVFQRLQAVPVVERAAVANSGMLTGGMASNMVTIQSDRRFAGDRAVARMRVGPGFFPTIGAPLIAGRDFDERDVRPAGDQAARVSIGDRQREFRAALLQGSESDWRPHRHGQPARHQDHDRNHRRGEGLQPAHACATNRWRRSSCSTGITSRPTARSTSGSAAARKARSARFARRSRKSIRSCQ